LNEPLYLESTQNPNRINRKHDAAYYPTRPHWRVVINFVATTLTEMAGRGRWPDVTQTERDCNLYAPRWLSLSAVIGWLCWR